MQMSINKMFGGKARFGQATQISVPDLLSLVTKTFTNADTPSCAVHFIIALTAYSSHDWGVTNRPDITQKMKSQMKVIYHAELDV